MTFLPERLAAIPQDATISVREFTVHLDEAEPWIRLDVDGKGFAALPRAAFLAAFRDAFLVVTDAER